MKIKAWIKKFRTPRLIVEAILVFSSVYMALVLEANRSRDFELQNTKKSLGIIQEKLRLERDHIHSYYLDSKGVFQTEIFKRDSIVYNSLLQNKIIPKDILTEIENGDFLMFENLNTWDQNDYILEFQSSYSQYTTSYELINEFNNYHKLKSMNSRWWNSDLKNLDMIESTIFNKFILGQATGEEIVAFMENSPLIMNSYKNHLYRMKGRSARARRIYSKTETLIRLIDKEIIDLDDQIDGISY